MLSMCYVYMQGSGWGPGSLLSRRHYLCICKWTGLSTDIDLEMYGVQKLHQGPMLQFLSTTSQKKKLH